MTTLEERVARALWLDVYPDLPWESHRRNEQIKDDYRGHARAAIAAVREHEARAAESVGKLKYTGAATVLSVSTAESMAVIAAEAMRARCEAIAKANKQLTVDLESTRGEIARHTALFRQKEAECERLQLAAAPTRLKRRPAPKRKPAVRRPKAVKGSRR